MAAIAPVNSDTLFTLLKAQGIQFTPGSDAELHILGEMPFPVSAAVPTATFTNAVASLSTVDKNRLTSEMSKRKGTK